MELKYFKIPKISHAARDSRCRALMKDLSAEAIVRMRELSDVVHNMKRYIDAAAELERIELIATTNPT